MGSLLVLVAVVLAVVFPYESTCQTTSATPTDVSRCPFNLNRNQYLHAFRERCYEFIVYRETYWNEAEKECVRRGGRLATVDDIETQTFFENTLQSLHFHKDGLWIGLNDKSSEGTYEWISGAPMRFTNWARGEPSLLHNFEDCIMMDRNKGFGWADHACDLRHYEYICEYDKIPTTSPTETATSSPAGIVTN